MVRIRHVRWVRAMPAAAVAVVLLVLLSLTGLYVAGQRGSSAAQTNRSRAPLGSGYGATQSDAGGTYWTPVGTVSFGWGTPSDTELVHGPIIALSEALKLSPSQASRIQAIQQQTQQSLLQEQQGAETRMKALFQEIKHTQDNVGRLLPYSDPVSHQVNQVVAQITLSRREQRMRDVFGSLAGVVTKTTKRLKEIEQTGAQEIEKELDGPQQAALPRLLADTSAFRRLSLDPAERYVALNLSEDQRYRMTVLAQRVKNEQSRGQEAVMAQIRSRMTMTPQQRRSLPRMRGIDTMRAAQEMSKAHGQVRQQARREALAILTPAQCRSLAQITTYPGAIQRRENAGYP